jgi:hypothetical protein
MNEACEWVRLRIPRHLDRELSEDEEMRVAEHLSSCARCRAAYEALERGDQLVREAAGPDIPDQDAGAEEREFAKLLGEFQTRYDLDAAERFRRKEMEAAAFDAAAEADARREPRAFMSAEEVASAGLEQAILKPAREKEREREGRGVGGFLARLFAPAPAWRWVSLTGAAAAVATITIVMLVRDGGLREEVTGGVPIQVTDAADQLAGGRPAAGRQDGDTGADAVTHGRPQSLREMETPTTERMAAQKGGTGLPAAAPSLAEPEAEEAGAPVPPAEDALHTAGDPSAANAVRIEAGRAGSPQLGLEAMDLATDREAPRPPTTSVKAARRGPGRELLTFEVDEDRSGADDLWLRVVQFVEGGVQAGQEPALPAGDTERVELLLAAEEKLGRRTVMPSLAGDDNAVPRGSAPPAVALASAEEGAAYRASGAEKKEAWSASRARRDADSVRERTVAAGALQEAQVSGAAWVLLGDAWYELWQGGVGELDAHGFSAPGKAKDAYENALAAETCSAEEYARIAGRLAELKEFLARP